MFDKTERNWRRRDIVEIYDHEDYARRRQEGDADIVILLMNEEIDFSDYIQPVCLPPANAKIENVVGTVAGYGKHSLEQKHESIPRHVELKIISLLTCVYRDKLFVSLASHRTFCAGGKNESPCRGKANLD